MSNVPEEFKQLALDTEIADQAKNIVVGRGNGSQVFIIGEAPGADEDEQGVPFVGKSGQILDEKLHKLNITDYFITNVVKARPPENRTPTKEEIRKHKYWMAWQFADKQPDVLVTLGNIPTKLMLSAGHETEMDDKPGITSICGDLKKYVVDSFESYFVPCVHPASTLYNPDMKGYWDDAWATVQNCLENRLESDYEVSAKEKIKGFMNNE